MRLTSTEIWAGVARDWLGRFGEQVSDQARASIQTPEHWFLHAALGVVLLGAVAAAWLLLRRRLAPARSGSATPAAPVDQAMLATISHDVRTPLTGIIGTLELLGYSELTPRQRSLVEGAEHASRTLQQRIESLLALVWLGAGAAPRGGCSFMNDARHGPSSAEADLSGRPEPDASTREDAQRVVRRLLDVFGEDAAAMDDYLRLMCNEEQRLLLHLDGRDLQRLREVAHYLCGMGSFFGAQRLSVLAGAVEPGRDAEEVLGHAKALHDYLAGFIDALRASSEEASAAANNTNAISDTSHGNASGAALEH